MKKKIMIGLGLMVMLGIGIFIGVKFGSTIDMQKTFVYNNKAYVTPKGIDENLFKICSNIYERVNSDFISDTVYILEDYVKLRYELTSFNADNLDTDNKTIYELCANFLMFKIDYDNTNIFLKYDKDNIAELQNKLGQDRIYLKNNLEQFKTDYLNK